MKFVVLWNESESCSEEFSSGFDFNYEIANFYIETFYPSFLWMHDSIN